VRNRVRASIEDDTALTSAEATAWRVFEAALLGSRPAEGHVSIYARSVPERAAALQRALSVLFAYFRQVITGRGQQPAEAGAPAAAAVAPGAGLGPPVAAGGAAADLAATASYGSEAYDLTLEAASSDGSMVDLVTASGSPDGNAYAAGGSAVNLIAQVRHLSLDAAVNNTNGGEWTGVDPGGPSDAAPGPPVADGGDDVELDDNGVPCPPDTWKTPLFYISEATARGADRFTVCDPMDPL